MGNRLEPLGNRDCGKYRTHGECDDIQGRTRTRRITSRETTLTNPKISLDILSPTGREPPALPDAQGLPHGLRRRRCSRTPGAGTGMGLLGKPARWTHCPEPETQLSDRCGKQADLWD